MFQVGQGAVDLAQPRDVTLGLEDGPAALQQGAGVVVAAQT
jgi:hypothetical protein